MASIYKRRYWVTTTEGKREQRKSERYTIEYRVDGKLVREKGPKDRKSANARKNEIERLVERGEAGLLNPYREHLAKKFEDCVQVYLAHLKTRGLDPMYVYNAEHRLKRLGKEAGWATLGNVTADSFIKWRDHQSGKAPRTLNQWLETASTFCNHFAKRSPAWLPGNPFASVEKVAGDDKRVRRAMSDDEIGRLLASAPEDRRIAYEFALGTGLRVQEMADLEWQDVRLEATAPHLRLRAGKTKARREQSVTLRADVAESLRTMRPDDYAAADKVFSKVPSLKLWKADLENAREAWIKEAETPKERASREKSDFLRYLDSAGRQADRHSMRMTLCTRLQRAGVAPRVAQEVMRHSDLKLTMKTYMDTSAFPLVAAVESLPAFPKPPQNVVPNAPTATEAVLSASDAHPHTQCA